MRDKKVPVDLEVLAGIVQSNPGNATGLEWRSWSDFEDFAFCHAENFKSVAIYAT